MRRPTFVIIDLCASCKGVSDNQYPASSELSVWVAVGSYSMSNRIDPIASHPAEDGPTQLRIILNQALQIGFGNAPLAPVGQGEHWHAGNCAIHNFERDGARHKGDRESKEAPHRAASALICPGFNGASMARVGRNRKTCRACHSPDQT